MTANRHKVSFGDDENVLKLESGDHCKLLDILKMTELYTSKW